MTTLVAIRRVYREALASALRKQRRARGFSLRELGKLSDVDHAYIWRLEAGEKDDPSEDLLRRLDRALQARR